MTEPAYNPAGFRACLHAPPEGGGGQQAWQSAWGINPFDNAHPLRGRTSTTSLREITCGQARRLSPWTMNTSTRGVLCPLGGWRRAGGSSPVLGPGLSERCLSTRPRTWASRTSLALLNALGQSSHSNNSYCWPSLADKPGGCPPGP